MSSSHWCLVKLHPFGMLTYALSASLLRQRMCKQFLAQSTHTTATTRNAEQPAGNYIPVYYFPYIRGLAIVHKAKVYQSVATCIGIPVSFALAAANACSTDICAGLAALGVSGCVFLHTLGFLTSNTVGIIYLHKDGMESKVSYLDAWGSRKDINIKLIDIVPFSDQAASITDPLYLKLEQYSSKDTYKLNVRYGVVLNAKKFEVIFHKPTLQ